MKPICIWMTGLSAAGKSTLARGLRSKLISFGAKPVLLDADDLRQGINSDLKFGREDKRENSRRMAHLARLAIENGGIPIVCSIAPFKEDRDQARKILQPYTFLETYVECPLDVCRSRDPKGMYARFDAGLVKCLAGVDDVYDEPLAPDLRLRTYGDDSSPDDLVRQVFDIIYEFYL